MHEEKTLEELLGILSADCGDELRSAWCDNHDTCDKCYKDLADAIKQKVGEEYKRGYGEGYASADDWYAEHADELNMHGYVRGPFGADNKMIYVGDVVTVDGIDHPVTVTRMYLFDYDWRIKLRGIDYTVAPSKCRQYLLPTVEDVLREFALKVAGKECITMRQGVVEEYAKRLRLAEEGDKE